MRALLAVVALALVGAGCSSTGEADPAPAPSSTAPTSPASSTPTPAGSPSLLMEPDLRRVGHLFVAFAEGRRDGPPSDTPVDLLLGSRRIATLDGSQLAARDAWRVCPPEGLYAARTCPFSALDVLRTYDGRVRMTTRPPDHPCMARADRPYRGRWLTLEPTGDADCLSWFAVALAVNDVSQVTAVDLVLPEP